MADDLAGNGSASGFVDSEFFLKGFERRFAEVPLPGGRKARIRNLTERERVGFEEAFYDLDKKKFKQDMRIGLISMCLVDAQGEPLFRDFAKIRDRLFDFDYLVTCELFDACWSHCGFSDEDRAKMLEESFPAARESVSSSV